MSRGLVGKNEKKHEGGFLCLTSALTFDLMALDRNGTPHTNIIISIGGALALLKLSSIKLSMHINSWKCAM